jgi:hypothetical protein
MEISGGGCGTPVFFNFSCILVGARCVFLLLLPRAVTVFVRSVCGIPKFAQVQVGIANGIELRCSFLVGAFVVDSWYLVLGSWFLVLGSWVLGLGS